MSMNAIGVSQCQLELAALQQMLIEGGCEASAFTGVGSEIINLWMHDAVPMRGLARAMFT